MGSGDTLHEQSYYFGESLFSHHGRCVWRWADMAKDQIIQRYEATIAAVFYG